MPKVKIILDQRGIRDVLHSDGVVEALYNEAEPILEEAIHLAPVDTGAYRAAFKIIEHVEYARTVVRVVNTDHKALLVESQASVLKKSGRGKIRQSNRVKARQRAADRRHDKAIKAQEDREGF